MRKRTVLVTGATGVQGSHVVRELVTHGWRVRAMTHRPDSARARALAGPRVTVVAADVRDPAALREAVAGVDAVYLVEPWRVDGVDGSRTAGVAVANAAAGAGVRHVVFSSMSGAGRPTDVPHLERKRAVELHLRNLGLATTILRPALIMERAVGFQGGTPMLGLLAGALGGYQQSSAQPQNAPAPSPACDGPIVPVDLATVPMDRATVPVDRATVPVDRATVPVDRATVPVGRPTVPARSSVPVGRSRHVPPWPGSASGAAAPTPRVPPGGGHRPVQVVAAADVATLARLALEEPDRHVGLALDVAGDELTVPEMVTMYRSVTGMTPPGGGRPVLDVEIATRGDVPADLPSLLQWVRESGFRADVPSLRNRYPWLSTFAGWLLGAVNA